MLWESLRELSDEDALTRAKTDFDAARADKEQQEQRNLRYLNIYKALDPPDLEINETTGRAEDDEGLYANTYLSVGASIVDATVRRLYKTLFSTPEFIEIGVRDWMDGWKAHKVTAHLLTRFNEMGFKRTIRKTILQACCFDYAITGTRWKLEAGYVPKRQKTRGIREYGPIKMREQTVRVVQEWVPNAIDRSDVFQLDYFDCYPDPSARGGFDDSHYFIDYREEKIEEIIGKARTDDSPYGRYENVDKLLTKIKDRIGGGRKEPVFDKNDPMSARRIVILRYWTRDQLLEFCPDFDHILSRVNLSGWPLQCWTIYDDPELPFGGMGILQRLERMQYDINATLNSRRQIQLYMADPIGAINRDLLSAGEGVPEIYPGRLFVDLGGGAAQDKLHLWQPATDPTGSSMADLEQEIGIMHSTAATSPAVLAQPATGRRSAFEMSEVAEGSDTETDVVAENMETDGIIQIAQNLFVLEQTLLSQKESFTYFGRHGDELMVIDPADYAFRKQPNFYARGLSSFKRTPLENQQFLAMMRLAMMYPQVHNMQNIFTEAWRRLVPRDYNKFVKDPREPQPNVPPEIENYLIAHGQQVEVSPANDHGQHRAVHEGYKKTADYHVWPDVMKRRLDMHIQEHTQAEGQTPGRMELNTQDVSDAMRGLRLTGPQNA